MADPSRASELRPGTTVASFRWPAVCRVLSTNFGSELDRVAELISERAQRSKSLVGVLGLFPEAGCTTVALSLAERLARGTHKTILVEGSFCKPRLAAWLDAVPTAGWQEVLKQESPLCDAIIRATNDHLDLLALAPSPTIDPGELVARVKTTECAGLLRATYGVAIVDLGTFFDAHSQAVALELVRRMEIEAVVAVAGPGPADERDLATVAGHLKRSGCALLGTIENRVPKTQATNSDSLTSDL